MNDPIQARVSDLDPLQLTLSDPMRYFFGTSPLNEVCSIARSINALRAVRAC